MYMVHFFNFSFFFNDTATTEIYTLSLHDALPISGHQATEAVPASHQHQAARRRRQQWAYLVPAAGVIQYEQHPLVQDRKSTRLNSSHVKISYAVFCLKKKKKKKRAYTHTITNQKQ